MNESVIQISEELKNMCEEHGNTDMVIRLAAIRLKNKYGYDTYPLPVTELAEKLGFTIIYSDKLPLHIIASLYNSNERNIRTININPQFSADYQRVSVARLIAHIIFNYDKIFNLRLHPCYYDKSISIIDYKYEQDDSDAFEYKFALDLLMPNCIDKVKNMRKKQMLKKDSISNSEILFNIASFYGTSLFDVAYKIKNTNFKFILKDTLFESWINPNYNSDNNSDNKNTKGIF